MSPKLIIKYHKMMNKIGGFPNRFVTPFTGGGENPKGVGELGTFGAGSGKGGGGPKRVTEFLHCRDTAGPPLWGGDVGPDKED